MSISKLVVALVSLGLSATSFAAAGDRNDHGMVKKAAVASKVADKKGPKKHGKKHHGKKDHGKKHHGKRDHGRKDHGKKGPGKDVAKVKVAKELQEKGPRDEGRGPGLLR